MKYIILLVILISANANAEIGIWTGKFSQLEDEKPNVSLWACEYKVGEYKQVLIYEMFCPIEVEIDWSK